MNSSYKTQLMMALVFSILTFPTFGMANPNSIDLIKQSSNSVQRPKNLLQRLDDWFNGPAPWEIVTTPIEETLDNAKNYIWGASERKSTQCGPRRYEYVGPRSDVRDISCCSSVQFTPNLDALRFTPNDWKETDYRKAKQVLSQQFFTNRFGQKKKRKKRAMGKVVYKPKERKKRLGQVDFSKGLTVLKKTLELCYNHSDDERRANVKSSGIWQSIQDDITTIGKQSSLLSVTYKNEQGKKTYHWLLAYKIEACYIKEVGQGDETKRKAYALEVLDLDPYRSARLKDVNKACFRLFYLENQDNFALENTFLETFDKVRPKNECDQIQPKTYVGRNRLYWYNMPQMKFTKGARK